MGIPAALGVSASGLPSTGDQANAVISGTFTSARPSQPFAFLGTANVGIFASFNTTLTTTNGSLTASVASAGALAAGCAVRSANVPPGTTWATFSGTSGTLALPALTLRGIATSASQIMDLASTDGLVGATVSGPGIQTGTTVLSVIIPAVAPTLNSPGVKGVVSISAPPTSLSGQSDAFTFALGANAIKTGADASATFTGAPIIYSGSVQIEASYDGGNTWVVASADATGAMAQYAAGTPVWTTISEAEKSILYRLNCTSYASGTINYRVSQTGGASASIGITSVV